MRKAIYLMLLLCSGIMMGQTIKVKKSDNNIIEAPAIINGVGPFMFIVDTGASECSIPTYVFNTLVKIGAIKRDDMLIDRAYKLADGSISTNARFIVRELRLGDMILKDVSFSINPSVDAPFLLGQNVFGRYKTMKIDFINGIIKLEK